MFNKAIIDKNKILTFPLAPLDLLLEVADLSPCLTFSLEDLKREASIT